ncbi:NAD(P)-binding domain-containing protein [Microbacterium sp.]|uniref:NAD(P)-binding domain-containing protein n=1 Tax=Microbacterium sp. TaxID=51671 RepID=UPI003C74FB9C
MTTYGFVGVGSIASAMVEGLCDGVADAPPVVLSPRSEARSRELAGRLPTVSVAASNQEVVERSDIVIVAVLPQQAAHVLGDLEFRPGQVVISVMAGVGLEMIVDAVEPATEVARSIPLPAVAGRRGETPIFPSTNAARQLFSRLGGYAELPSERAFEAVAAASATVAAHLWYLDSIKAWLCAEGIDPQFAARYVATTFVDVAGEINPSRVDFRALASNHATAGGLNEQFSQHLAQAGAYEAVAEGLDGLLRRLTAIG